ncbi:MAG: hypothetical protein ABFC42_09385 [Sulfuricella sp.]
MSLFSAQPESIERYAMRTSDMKPSMPNVYLIPRRAKCTDCGKPRTEASGVMKKRGWICGMCK